MKTRIISSLFAGFIVLAFSVSASAAPDPIDGQVSPVHRTTIFVRDMTRSLTLYRDTLGLIIRRDITIEGEPVNAVLGTEGKTFRIVILQSGDLTIGNVALAEYVGEDGGTAPEQPNNLGPGDVALIFESTDIDRIFSAAKNQGLTIISPPTVLFEVPDLAEQAREGIFLDPDGIAINIIQPGVPAAE